MAGIGDSISSFFNPDDAYKQAQEQLQKYFQMAQGYEMPFMNAAGGQLPRLTGAEDQLLDPTALENKWASQYQLSPQAQQEMNQAKSSGLDAASSMGLMGSSAALNNIQRGSSNIMNADRQSFMNDLMQKFLSGIGIGQNIYGTGASAANNMAGNAMTMGSNMGQMKYGEAAAPGQLFGDMLGKLMGSSMSGLGQGGAGGAGAGSGGFNPATLSAIASYTG